MITGEIKFPWYSRIFGLMSHRDVLGNVVYGLEVKGVPRIDRERKQWK